SKTRHTANRAVWRSFQLDILGGCPILLNRLFTFVKTKRQAMLSKKWENRQKYRKYNKNAV
ncbi:hypothetical protein, partial [Enterobacter kobei]|uniref:hypothetical protein n=1 Tax=Enterobacter kobei TaxID=208224 RepID=UPI001E58E84D